MLLLFCVVAALAATPNAIMHDVVVLDVAIVERHEQQMYLKPLATVDAGFITAYTADLLAIVKPVVSIWRSLDNRYILEVLADRMQ